MFAKTYVPPTIAAPASMTNAASPAMTQLRNRRFFARAFVAGRMMGGRWPLGPSRTSSPSGPGYGPGDTGRTVARPMLARPVAGPALAPPAGPPGQLGPPGPP